MKRPCFKLELPYPQPVAGVDEAGCAPLAGPVVAAAVILDHFGLPGLDRSPITLARVAGVTCILIGVLLVRR